MVGGVIAAAGAYDAYVVMLVACSLGVSVIALRLGRHLTPSQDTPQHATRVVAHSPDRPTLAPEAAAH